MGTVFAGVNQTRPLKTTAFSLAGASMNIGSVGRAFAAKDLTVGVVYVGARDDFGGERALVHAGFVAAAVAIPMTAFCRHPLRSRSWWRSP